MKTLLITVLTITILIIFSACAGEEQEILEDEDISAQTEEIPFKGDQEYISFGFVTYTNGIVDLTMPKEFIATAAHDEVLSHSTDLIDFAERNDYIFAKWYNENYLTVTMTEVRYEEYKEIMAAPVEEIIEGLDTEEFIDGIEKALDYETVTILVDRGLFEEEGITSPEDIASYCYIQLLKPYINTYRMFVGLDSNFSIILIDSNTGDEFYRESGIHLEN